MGGFSIVMIILLMSLTVLAVLAVTLAMFIAATVITIIYVCKSNERKIKGEKLGGKIAIPIVLYVISTPVLLWFFITFIYSVFASI